MPYTPQTDGVLAWANRTSMEGVQCMLDDAGLSKKYWAIAVSVAVNLKNSIPAQSDVSYTTYEAWHGRKPYLKHLCVFGCLAPFHVANDK
jgi:hypothetical protein